MKFITSRMHLDRDRDRDRDDKDFLSPFDEPHAFDEPQTPPLHELFKGVGVEDDLKYLDDIDNILEMKEDQYPEFTLAKNKARFLRMFSWYKNKNEWLKVAPLSGVTRLFKQQTKELEGIRSHKMDYEMELEMGTLTPSQKSYRKDELKMCKVHERMAIYLISKMQFKIKNSRR